MCPGCRSLSWDALPLSGRGTIHSWMLPVHPQLPMFEYPLICVLVDLDEGIRLFSNLYDCAPENVRNGMPVEVFIQTGERTPINYLLKPITDYFNRAMREK